MINRFLIIITLTILILTPGLLNCQCIITESVNYPELTQKSIINIRIDWTQKKQTIAGNGINFEGYHLTGGSEILSPEFEKMLASLPCQINRLSMPLKEWEPINDNSDFQLLDLMAFNDNFGAHNTFLRIKELKNRGIETWLSVWDVADWNVRNPQNKSQRRIIDINEMAESVCAFLLYGKERYDIEPLYISVNEPTIASENGWGGYHISLSAEEQINLIIKAGELFEKHHINTKWIIALHKIYPSEIEQARHIFNNPLVKKYVAGFDFHGYGMQTDDKDPYFIKWRDWVSTTGLITFCGECDYDNKYWEKEERKYWDESSKKYGLLFHKLINVAAVNGFQPWYSNIPSAEYPYRYVSKHFMEAFLPGTIIVSTSSDNSEIRVTAGKHQEKCIIIIQNTSSDSVELLIKGQAMKELNWICSQTGSFFKNKGKIPVESGDILVLLTPNSLNTFTGITKFK